MTKHLNFKPLNNPKDLKRKIDEGTGKKKEASRWDLVNRSKS